MEVDYFAIIYPFCRCLKEEWRVLNTSGLKHEAGGKDGGRGGEEPSSSQVRLGSTGTYLVTYSVSDPSTYLD
jgi:hypothetical protein